MNCWDELLQQSNQSTEMGKKESDTYLKSKNQA